MPDIIWQPEKELNIKNDQINFDQALLTPSAPLQQIRYLLKQSKIDVANDDLPNICYSGLFGYIGYDSIRWIEAIDNSNLAELNIPMATLMRPQILVVFDNITQMMCIVSPVYTHVGNSDLLAQQVFEQKEKLVESVIKKLSQNTPHHTSQSTTIDKQPISSNIKADDFKQVIKKAKEYILSGDIFQVVLSQRFSTPFKKNPFDLYRSLRRLNPSPFLFFMRFDDWSLVGSSPEILVRLRDNRMTIRPIAGTRKRGKDAHEDKAIAHELLNNTKERAEHLMLLDLARNDIGKVCENGSVEVTNSFYIEYYSHVMHIVSNVEGQIKPEHDVLDAFMAGFPHGTVSGAPKIRAMEIIDELETVKRQTYGGGIGYFGANGDMDMCLALRTAVVKDNTLYVQAGAGVVADSTPDDEHQECINKAQAIFSAAENIFA